MEKIYITEPDAINVAVLEPLVPAQYQIVRGTTDFTGEDLQAVSVLVIRSATTVANTIQSQFPNLKHVIRAGVGVDNIDVEFCTHQGISVYNAPGANADAVSDYVVGMMFHALRNLHLLTSHDLQAWNRFKFTGHSMAGRTIGIIGFGNIGKQIFAKLQAFNCQGFYVYDPFIKAEDLPQGSTYAATIDEVLKHSDIVTLHVPLLPTTKYLVNKDNLGLLPDGTILINASRGGIVNEADVIAHTANGDRKLIYIADTVEGEPHPSQALLDSPGVIVTPHIASLTAESDDNIVKVAFQNFLNHKPMNAPSV